MFVLPKSISCFARKDQAYSCITIPGIILKIFSMTDTLLLKIANIELDSHRMEVRRNKKLIPLTPLEFKLLEYLIRNKNTIVSRKELLTQLWQYSPDIQ